MKNTGKTIMILTALVPLAAVFFLAGQLASYWPAEKSLGQWAESVAACIQGKAGPESPPQPPAPAQPDAAQTKAYSALVKDLGKELEAKEVRIQQTPSKINIEFVEKVLFAPGSAVITAQGKVLLGKLDALFKSEPDKHVYVIGHTDNTPIANAAFASNWELSTGRACAVIRYLIDAAGQPPSRFYAMGRADQQPIADNATDQGRAANRRVEIVIADIPDLTGQAQPPDAGPGPGTP